MFKALRELLNPTVKNKYVEHVKVGCSYLTNFVEVRILPFDTATKTYTAVIVDPHGSRRLAGEAGKANLCKLRKYCNNIRVYNHLKFVDMSGYK